MWLWYFVIMLCICPNALPFRSLARQNVARVPLLHSIRRNLNRIFFEDAEVEYSKGSISLPVTDFRAKHITQILKLKSGDTIRAGVLDHGLSDNCTVQFDCNEVTDPSKITSVTIHLPNAIDFQHSSPQNSNRVDLLLATPRPSRLASTLPVISSLGVHRLVLLGGERVNRDYFGSHLFRDAEALRSLLVDGLMQANGDCMVPEVLVEKDLSRFFTNSNYDHFFENRFENLSSLQLCTDENADTVLKLVAHPPDSDLSPAVLSTLVRFSHIVNELSRSPQKRISRVIIAVGPEGGWLPNEVEQFISKGYRLYQLGNRILRTDTAVSVLLGHAHEILYASDSVR